MRGRYHIIIQNRRIKFELEIKRNITIIRGDSATGKTTLMNLIEANERLGEESGVSISCERKCKTINNSNWENVINQSSECIIFADEDIKSVKSREFAEKLKYSNNYYVIITREKLPNLPYSVEEVYGIHNSGKYSDIRQTYNSLYNLYSSDDEDKTHSIDMVLIEDSNSGFQFFKASVVSGVECVSAGGKTKIDNLQLLKVWENRKKGNTIEDTETADIIDDQNDTISNDSEDTEAMALGKSMLRITLPNGNIIFEKKPTETYVKAIEQAGIDRVKGLNIRRCGIQLIRKNKDWQYTQKRLSDGQYLFSNLSTKDKKRLLEQINEALKLGWHIEITGESKGKSDHNQDHFSMVVDNIFFVNGMGAMLNGKIELGTIHSGDEVVLDNGTRAFVDRIQLENRIVEESTKDEYVGLHIGFVDKNKLSKVVKVEDSANHDNSSFEMRVVEVHNDANQGVVLKGDVIKGSVKVGDPVRFIDGETFKFSSAVSSINMQGGTVDSAEEGQSVVLYFNDVTKKKMEGTIWTICR